MPHMDYLDLHTDFVYLPDYCHTDYSDRAVPHTDSLRSLTGAGEDLVTFCTPLSILRIALLRSTTNHVHPAYHNMRCLFQPEGEILVCSVTVRSRSFPLKYVCELSR